MLHECADICLPMPHVACFWSNAKICASEFTKDELDTKDLSRFDVPTQVNLLIIVIPLKCIEFAPNFCSFKMFV